MIRKFWKEQKSEDLKRKTLSAPVSVNEYAWIVEHKTEKTAIVLYKCAREIVTTLFPRLF